ncbi:MAG: RNA 2'-phosphotransferase [Bacteroidia bacterium]|nr:RNA 2'-phosphotransferase [Bacteroidia bacterium]
MKDLKHKSRFLSLVLRHKPETIGLSMDANGWVNVDELIEKCNQNNFPLDFSLLEEIVETNDKNRFSFSEDLLKIRANQGHSVEIDLALAPKEAPALLYHGTVEKFLESINQQGLKKMERQHVHLSKDLQTAQKVGSRRGKPVILKINAQQMQADGYVFYQSDNGVWLCEEVPAKYIEFS